MDILRVLGSPDLEVRKKTLSLVLELINSRNVDEVTIHVYTDLHSVHVCTDLHSVHVCTDLHSVHVCTDLHSVHVCTDLHSIVAITLS